MIEIESWDDLPTPPVLKHTLWIKVSYNKDNLWYISPRCELITVRKSGDDWFGAPVECLYFAGAIVKDRNNIPSRLETPFMLLPVQYVTYIGLGPELSEIVVNKDIDQVIVAPSAQTPADRMPVKTIRATLAELVEPLG